MKLFLFGIFLFVSVNISESRVNAFEESTMKESFEESTVRWWIDTFHGDSWSYVCCCADGNQYVCSGLAINFNCTPGGIFECSRELQGPHEDLNYKCDRCCPGGPCA